MQHNNYLGDETSRQQSGWPWANVAFIAFLAIAIFYLITEHTAHLWGYLPFLLLLACPLLHFFMHSDHGGHSGGLDDKSPQSNQPVENPPSSTTSHRGH